MKEVTLKIGKLFEFFTKKGIEFKNDEFVEINDIKIRDENSEFVNVSHLITKKDKIKKITLSSGIVSRTAAEHKYCISESGECKNITEMIVGDTILTNKGKDTIILIEDEDEEIVFDLRVNTESHLYQTTNGIIHHNTSFLNSISTLTGVPLVIIEAPHITAEHLINIPFLVIDGLKKRTGNIQLETDSSGDLKIVQAESNLVTQLRTHKQKSREEIEQLISKNAQLKAVYESPDVQRRLMGIDGMFNSILFLDEYFRTSSKQIKNVLRNILNGRIGCWDYSQEVEIETTNENFKNFLKEKGYSA